MVTPDNFVWLLDEQGDINVVIRDYLPGWTMDDKVSIFSKTDSNYQVDGSCPMSGIPTFYYKHELTE